MSVRLKTKRTSIERRVIAPVPPNQRNLAAILGTTEQTLSLWERQRKKAMPGSADRLLRALYRDFIKDGGSVRGMLERLATLDQIKQPGKTCWRETREGWQLDA